MDKTRPDKRWSIVCDNRKMRIHFVTEGNKKVRSIKVGAFDLSCGAPVRALDVDVDPTGDVTDEFRDYTPELNMDLVRTTFEKFASIARAPPSVVELWGRYPEECRCGE